MKIKIYSILIVFVLLTCSFGLIACGGGSADGNNDIEGTQGLTYMLSSDKSYYLCSGTEDANVEEIIIANTYKNKPVKKVALGAFAFSSTIKKVTLQGNIIELENDAFRGCDRITDIIYMGTKSQWNAIHKGDRWNQYFGQYTVHCSDGDLSNA